MNNSQLIKIVNGLHKRTDRGLIAWEATVEAGEFQAAFADYSVRIAPRFTVRYLTEPDYVLKFFNEDGQLLESVSNTDFEDAREDFYEIMKDLYEGARRKALRVDEALASILEELGE
jgi:hypothetical protein